MPLLGSQFINPVRSSNLSKRPDENYLVPNIPSKAPAKQGDHVFGNIIDIMETWLQSIIGGKKYWSTRFTRTADPYGCILNYDNNFYIYRELIKSEKWIEIINIWERIQKMDLGHSSDAPVSSSKRQEQDTHQYVFGHYAKIFLWDLGEIGGVLKDKIVIGSDTADAAQRWIDTVRGSYTKMINLLVDETSLMRYLEKEIINTTHKAISLLDTRSIINGSDKKAKLNKFEQKILAIINNFDELEPMMNRMLDNISNINICWNNDKNCWMTLR